MADATIKTSRGDVAQELLSRANAILGYPKVGKAANGAIDVGGGIHVADSDVKTEALTEVGENSANGDTLIFVTDDFRTVVDTVKAAAQERINKAAALPFDAEIVSLGETGVEFGDLSKPVPKKAEEPNGDKGGAL